MRHIATLALFFLAPVAFAGIEKTAAPSENGIRLMWWPRISVPKGWHHDPGSSQYFAFNAIAPDGSTFSKAETVLYAKANYKPRSPETTTLAALIASDISRQRSEEPGLIVTHEPPMHGNAGLIFKVVRFAPAKEAAGAWERVAYAEDGDYFITLVVSSHSQRGLDSSAGTFRTLLLGYTPGP
jgi:hypothetical protein